MFNFNHCKQLSQAHHKLQQYFMLDAMQSCKVMNSFRRVTFLNRLIWLCVVNYYTLNLNQGQNAINILTALWLLLPNSKRYNYHLLVTCSPRTLSELECEYCVCMPTTKCLFLVQRREVKPRRYNLVIWFNRADE